MKRSAADLLPPSPGSRSPVWSRSPIWSRRDVRLIAAGRAASVLGDALAVVALMIYAYGAGWGASAVSVLLITATLPLVLGAPAAGQLVDRLDSRVLTVGTALWQAACVAVMALLVGPLSPGATPGIAQGDGGGAGAADRDPRVAAGLVVALLALNAGQAVAGPAWTALLPAIVPEEDVPRAVGTLQAAFGLAGIAGPALGGLVVARWGTAPALWLDAASFLLLAVVALRLRGRRVPATVPAPEGGPGAEVAPPAPEGGPGAEASPPAPSRGMWAGFAVLRADPVLGPLLAGLVTLVLCLHTVLVAQVFMVTDELGGDTRAYGALGAVLAGGAALGAAAAGRVASSTARVTLSRTGTAVLALGVLGAGLSPSLWPFAAAMALVGLVSGAIMTAFNTLVLQRVPDALHGRVLAAVAGAFQACDLGGSALGAPLAGTVGIRGVYLVAGGAGLLVSCGVLAATRAMPEVGRSGAAHP